MIRIGIIGGGGYVARELISLLCRHPKAKLVFVTSNSQVNRSVQSVHKDVEIPADLVFTANMNPSIDVLFLCGGHGFSQQFLAENEISSTVTIIDLSTDFRTDETFSYGLPEINAYQYANGLSKRIANPGCFATAIQLGILPVLSEIHNSVHIHAITGSTGAGQSVSETSHFSWRENNVSSYKVLEHQHLTEITHTFKQRNWSNPELNFIPIRGSFTRGIFATIYFDCNLSQQEVNQIYTSFYAESPFVMISEQDIDLKQVVNTNYCILQPKIVKNKLVITSVIDNMLKGAAGQAIQNMNIAVGLDQKTGLNLKPTHF